MTKFVKRIALLITIPFFIWTGYWTAFAYAIERGISLASQNPQISGTAAQFEVASVTGYPQNFAIGITEIEIGAKDRFTWATQEVLVEAKSYQPNRINVDLSDPHSISGSIGSLGIDAELADLSVFFKPNLQNPQISGTAAQFEVASVTGYPQNFAIGITEIEIGAKDRFTWATQEVLVEAKSYQPNRINVDLSDPHSISGSIGSLGIDAELADLSVFFKPNLQLSLGNLDANFQNVILSFEGITGAEIETMSAHVSASPNTETNYQVTAQTQNLNLSNMLVGLGKDYQRIQNISLSAEAELSQPLDRLTMASGAPQLQMLLLRRGSY